MSKETAENLLNNIVYESIYDALKLVKTLRFISNNNNKKITKLKKVKNNDAYYISVYIKHIKNKLDFIIDTKNKYIHIQMYENYKLKKELKIVDILIKENTVKLCRDSLKNAYYIMYNYIIKLFNNK